MDRELEAGEIEVDRQLAAHYADRTQVNAANIIDQLAKTSGWLTATLLAVNGGGIAATLKVLEKSTAAAPSLWLFGAGLLWAMLNAFSIQWMASRMVRPMEHLAFLWRKASIEGVVVEADHAALEQALLKVARLSWVPPTLGWISAFCFVIGGLLLGWRLSGHA
ncbi:hypothetical protein M9978_02245 [Sphingomonas sp. MG17]|uniref:Uncharacterized protein n=1 Tax=Sphingomonas tagetis TaxID=2949092 RepID=A0A9X2KKD6_9SPHN|nr:hypothetical protein [Sphingomonas tagetis]MCP3729236.1 hypothetical protein [Sphingomonas tagetis]